MAIIGVAFLVRVITALQIAALPLSRNPHFDSLEYLGWARRVAARGLRLWRAATGRPPAATGFFVGLASLLRPAALILLPVFLFLGARTWRLRGVMAAVALAVLAPVTIANWRASHAFIPV